MQWFLFIKASEQELNHKVIGIGLNGPKIDMVSSNWFWVDGAWPDEWLNGHCL